MLIPDAFARAVVLREEAAGEAWLASVPGVLDTLLEQWSCIREGPPRHGQVGLVVPVRSARGAAVIKVSSPQGGDVHEGSALRQLRGSGAVRLYAEEPRHQAMLLERADGPRPAAVLTAEESAEMMGDLARQLRVPAAADAPRLSDAAAGWKRQLEEQLRRAPAVLERSAIERAREAIGTMAEDRTTTLLHGDLHEDNILGARRRAWLAIDLRGWCGTAAFDAWTVALTRPAELRTAEDPARTVRRRIRRFAECAEVDPALASELAHARAVSSLLHETLTAAETFGRELLRRLVAGRI